MIDYEAMGRRIRRKRQETGMTQQEMAAKINVSPSYFGHIERGTRIPSLDTLVLIANTLNTGLDALLRDSLTYTTNAYGVRPRFSSDDLRILRTYLDEQQRALENWLDCDTDVLSSAEAFKAEDNHDDC